MSYILFGLTAVLVVLKILGLAQISWLLALTPAIIGFCWLMLMICTAGVFLWWAGKD